jgi:hypothetical protein
MDDQTGLGRAEERLRNPDEDERFPYGKTSPFPIFIALGLALSEVGVFLGIVPLAVGGLLLFSGSVAGILSEAGYVATPWGTLLVIGGILLALSGSLYAFFLDFAGVTRVASIGVAAGLCMLGALVGRFALGERY